MAHESIWQTHEVFNQTPPLGDVNVFTGNPALRAAVSAYGGDGNDPSLISYGATAGRARARALARDANRFTPELVTFDGSGNRVDEVRFHPAWHELMTISTAQGLHCGAWENTSAPAVTRAAGFYMAAQLEHGHCCPITMTNAAVPVLKIQPEVASPWLEKLLVRDYDPAPAALADKKAITIGMGMTEKQGGTDVRSNTTRAEPAGRPGPGREYVITGHKWFLSAPQCDAFLVLARTGGGLSCFLMPRFLPDGCYNKLRLLRLKDKLGNRSNASSEVEFLRAHAWMIGEEGAGVKTIIEMVTWTRLDCATASAGMMGWALANAHRHASHRVVFQKKLIDQPLMRQVLADLTLDHEAALALVFRLAMAFDQRDTDLAQAAFVRVMTPVIKYWVCKTLPGFAHEAMECLGGNGFIEQGAMARVFRESPLNAIWEGCGNVMCLDLLRVARNEPDMVRAVLESLKGECDVDRIIDDLAAVLTGGGDGEAHMRFAAGRLAEAAAASLLRRHGRQSVADAFTATRLGGGFRQMYGSAVIAETDAILHPVA